METSKIIVIDFKSVERDAGGKPRTLFLISIETGSFRFLKADKEALMN